MLKRFYLSFCFHHCLYFCLFRQPRLALRRFRYGDSTNYYPSLTIDCFNPWFDAYRMDMKIIAICECVPRLQTFSGKMSPAEAFQAFQSLSQLRTVYVSKICYGDSTFVRYFCFRYSLNFISTSISLLIF